MSDKPSRRELLAVIGRLQGLIGDALQWLDSDRAQDAKARMRAALNSAHDLCITATEHDPPPVFGEFESVDAWLGYAEAHPCSPGCYVAGGGPPPPRQEIDGRPGFWLRGPSYATKSMYVWVPDEIAQRDRTGRYAAGQNSEF